MEDKNTSVQLPGGQTLVQTEAGIISVPTSTQVMENNIRKRRRREHEEMLAWYTKWSPVIEKMAYEMQKQGIDLGLEDKDES